MALLLHIETATEICSVALSKKGNLLSVHEERSPNSHSATLTLLIQKVFADAGAPLYTLDGVAVSAGPGSFTGLRIGASVAKGLCYALEKPLIAVPTLQAMAAGAAEQVKNKAALYCGVINSIKQEVYAGLYDFNLKELIASTPADNHLSSFQEYFKGKPVYCFGTGAKKLATPICDQAEILADFSNSAAHMIELAQTAFDEKKFAPVEYFEPLYVKGFVAR